MTSRRGIFRRTGVARHVGRVAAAFLKLMRAAGVLAVNRSGYEDLNPGCRHIEIHGEETCPIKE